MKPLCKINEREQWRGMGEGAKGWTQEANLKLNLKLSLN